MYIYSQDLFSLLFLFCFLVKQPLMAPGALRCLSAMWEDNGRVICGFSSGLLSMVDIRAGDVIATWKGHNDSVSQVGFFYFSTVHVNWVVTVRPGDQDGLLLKHQRSSLSTV